MCGHIRSLRILSAALLALLFDALPLVAATPELDRLTREVAGFAGGDAARSLELAGRLRLAENLASEESDAALRARLLARVAGLRSRLGAASRPPESVAEASGTFKGRVTHHGAPLAEVRIAAYLADRTFVGSTTSREDGSYSLALPPGAYLLSAEPPYGAYLAPQLYPGISCLIYSTCGPEDGTVLELVSGGEATADFALLALGRIAGRARARDTLEPLDGVRVAVYGLEGHYLTHGTVAGGAYQVRGLPPGRYYVVAVAGGERLGMLWHNVPCYQTHVEFDLQCAKNLGARVSLAYDQVLPNLDFDLYRVASISGKVLEAGSGRPLANAVVRVWSAGYVLHSVAAGEDGGYRISGLGPGRFQVQAEAGNGHTAQFFLASIAPATVPACPWRSLWRWRSRKTAPASISRSSGPAP